MGLYEIRLHETEQNLTYNQHPERYRFVNCYGIDKKSGFEVYTEVGSSKKYHFINGKYEDVGGFNEGKIVDALIVGEIEGDRYREADRLADF